MPQDAADHTRACHPTGRSPYSLYRNRATPDQTLALQHTFSVYIIASMLHSRYSSALSQPPSRIQVMRLSARSAACVIAISTLSLTACGTEPVSFDDLDGSGIIIGADASGTTDGSSIVEPDAISTPDGSNPSLDVSVNDTSTVEPDAGTDPEPDPTDAGSAPDLEPGQVCVPDSTECDGDILLTCAPDGTAVGRTRCASRGFVCGEDADGRAACVEGDPTVDPAVCEPGALTCSPDAAAVLRCNADGTAFEVAARCENGCNPDTSECNGGTVDPPVDPPVGCSDLSAEPLEQGTLNFSLCGAGNEYNYSPDGEECQFEIAGEERIFVLTLEEPTDVLIDLKDNDSSAAIDTVLYVQTTCGDNSTQVLCTDDVPCDESDVTTGCTDGFQPRQSRIDATFEPGTYYIIAEQLSYQSRRTGTRFSCGNVELIVEFNP